MRLYKPLCRLVGPSVPPSLIARSTQLVTLSLDLWENDSLIYFHNNKRQRERERETDSKRMRGANTRTPAMKKAVNIGGERSWEEAETNMHKKWIKFARKAKEKGGKKLKQSSVHFLVACTRLYKPLSRLVGRSVGPSVADSRSTRLMAIGLVLIHFPCWHCSRAFGTERNNMTLFRFHRLHWMGWVNEGDDFDSAMICATS